MMREEKEEKEEKRKGKKRTKRMKGRGRRKRKKQRRKERKSEERTGKVELLKRAIKLEGVHQCLHALIANFMIYPYNRNRKRK